MRVALGFKPIEGPWGGGVKFIQSLASKLEREGIAYSYALDPSVDMVLLADPRRGSLSSTFNDSDLFRFLVFQNPKALVVHRVNECDERKGTDYVNRDLRRAALLSDHSVFISSWLRDLHLAQGWPCPDMSVILNGADKAVFNADGAAVWDGMGPLRLVTHHWGPGWLKGFEVYAQLDELLGQAAWRELIDFTYVGRLPNSFTFQNVRYIEPLSGLPLAVEIKSHHAYLTASQNEPAGMHHVEGAMCGLPVMYMESGAIPEYCRGFGISFSPATLEEKLLEMRQSYFSLKHVMPDYVNSSEHMASQFVDLFRRLDSERKGLLKRRGLVRHWRWLRSRFGV